MAGVDCRQSKAKESRSQRKRKRKKKKKKKKQKKKKSNPIQSISQYMFSNERRVKRERVNSRLQSTQEENETTASDD